MEQNEHIKKEETLTTDIYFKLNTTDINVINDLMKHILNNMTLNHLDLIKEAKVQQTLTTIEVDYDAFEANKDNRL